MEVGLNFLRWAAGLTTDVCENASAHGDDRSPLTVVNLPEKNVSDLRAAVLIGTRATVNANNSSLNS